MSCANRALCSDDFLWLDPANPRRGPTARSGVPLGGRYFAGNASYTTRDGSITDVEGNLIPFVTSIDGYNRNAQRDLAIPTRRIMLAAEVDYPVAEGASVFAELNYGEARIDSSFEAHPFQSQASSSLFGGGPGVDGLEATIPVDNPFVPQELRDAVLAADPTATDITWWQRFAFFDNRGARSSRETVRAVAGLKGDLESIAGFGENWRWEVAHVWGQTKVDLGTEGLVSTGKLYYGLRVEPDPDNAGQFRCIDPGARATGCIPINPFNYTPEMIEALRLGASTEGTSELNDTVAWISGSAWQLPAGPLNVAAGLEYRSTSGYLNYDSIINQGLATGNQISDVDPVRVSTQEVFVEALVPVVRDLPFAQALDLEAAYRYSDTQDIDTYDTWKLGFVWSPVDSLRVRAMQARSVRTPIPGELSGIAQTFGVVQDPCTAARRNLNPTRAANCLSDGVPADYNPGQIIEQSVAGLSGGNPDLGPEQGTTRTYGLVWTPSFAPALAISIDRFEIEIDDIITTVARQTAVNLCYDQRLFCDVVTRGTNPLLPGATYVLTDVNEQLQNVAKYDIRGIDLDARYAFDIGRWGALNLKLLMTFYDKAEQTPLPGEAAIDLLGKAGGDTSDQGYVKQTGNLSVGYDLGQFNANWTMRYIGSAEMAVGSRDAGFPDIGAKTYHSLRLGYAFKEGSEVYVGANNLFDEDPPLFCSGCSGTQALDTIPGYYDVFGLSYYAGMRYRF